MTAPAAMTLPCLLRDGELEGFQGDPFDERLLEVACADVRGACDWHIAPVATTEAVRSGGGGPRLVLPTLRLVEVLEVLEIRTGGTDSPLTGWRYSAAGMLIRDAGWPPGLDNLRIRMRHGHDACPPELRAVVVERTRVLAAARLPGTQSNARTVDGVTRSNSVTDSSAARTPAWTLAAEAVLDRFRVR